MEGSGSGHHTAGHTSANNRAPAPFATLTSSQPACEFRGFGRRSD
jgi:hypothetical protein